MVLGILLNRSRSFDLFLITIKGIAFMSTVPFPKTGRWSPSRGKSLEHRMRRPQTYVINESSPIYCPKAEEVAL
jgi:hypothetical protein